VRAPASRVGGQRRCAIERYRFRHDVGAPCFLSSEVLFARLAWPLFKAESLRSGDGTFSIRWLGAIKFAAFFVTACGFTLAWWAAASRGCLRQRFIAAIVLTDPAINAYLNGFYAEYSTVLFGYASIAGAALLMGGRRRPASSRLFLLALAVAAFVGSKIQHIGWGLLLALAMALAGHRRGRGSERASSRPRRGGAVAWRFRQSTSSSPATTSAVAQPDNTVLTSLLPLSDDPYRTAESIGHPRRCGALPAELVPAPVSENPATIRVARSRRL